MSVCSSLSFFFHTSSLICHLSNHYSPHFHFHFHSYSILTRKFVFISRFFDFYFSTFLLLFFQLPRHCLQLATDQLSTQQCYINSSPIIRFATSFRIFLCSVSAQLFCAVKEFNFLPFFILFSLCFHFFFPFIFSILFSPSLIIPYWNVLAVKILIHPEILEVFIITLLIYPTVRMLDVHEMSQIYMILMMSLQAQRQFLLVMGWCSSATKCETNAQKLGTQYNFLFESVWNGENVSQCNVASTICFFSSQNKNYSCFYISLMHLHSSSIITQENKFQHNIPSYLQFFILFYFQFWWRMIQC